MLAVAACRSGELRIIPIKQVSQPGHWRKSLGIHEQVPTHCVRIIEALITVDKDGRQPQDSKDRVEQPFGSCLDNTMSWLAQEIEAVRLQVSSVPQLMVSPYVACSLLLQSVS